MSLPRFIVENAFSVTQFSGHTVVGDEEAAGHEAFRIANGRRSSFDYWTGNTANQQRTLTLDCAQTRSFDVCVLDRGHNLAGKQMLLECSNDNFGSTQTVFDVTIPSTVGPSHVDDPNGVTTEEGAWVKHFSDRAARYWRLRIPAMGAGVTPSIVGAWLGLSYQPAPFDLPFEPDGDELRAAETQTEAAWLGRNQPATVRGGTISMKLDSVAEYERARYHLQGHYGRGRPMWVIFDEAQADRAVLAIRPTGRLAFGQTREWWYPNVQLPFVEHEPRRHGG